jgi:hypothetical protein
VDGAILVDAFEGALKDLGLANRNDPAAQVVANHLVTFAKAGERDPARLRELTLEAVRVERSRPRRFCRPKLASSLWFLVEGKMAQD